MKTRKSWLKDFLGAGGGGHGHLIAHDLEQMLPILLATRACIILRDALPRTFILSLSEYAGGPLPFLNVSAPFFLSVSLPSSHFFFVDR